jgi:hypothetical protein
MVKAAFGLWRERIKITLDFSVSTMTWPLIVTGVIYSLLNNQCKCMKNSNETKDATKNDSPVTKPEDLKNKHRTKQKPTATHQTNK